MTAESYVMAWGIYLSCCAVLLVITWSATAKLKTALWRGSLRMTAAVLLLMPYSIAENYSELAPGIIMLAMEAMFEASPGRVGGPMLVLWAVLLTVMAIYRGWKAVNDKRQQKEKELDKPRRELLEQSMRVEPKL